MHEVGMDVVIIQELFRNEEYCGRHNTTGCAGFNFSRIGLANKY